MLLAAKKGAFANMSATHVEVRRLVLLMKLISRKMNDRGVVNEKLDGGPLMI